MADFTHIPMAPQNPKKGLYARSLHARQEATHRSAQVRCICTNGPPGCSKGANSPTTASQAECGNVQRQSKAAGARQTRRKRQRQRQRSTRNRRAAARAGRNGPVWAGKPRATTRQLLCSLALRLGAIAVLVCGLTFAFGGIRCAEAGMQPAVQLGDLCLFCRLTPLQVGAVVAYDADDGYGLRLGRVMALENSVVELDANLVVVDGVPYERTGAGADAKGAAASLQIPSGFCYIVGDCTAETHDSVEMGYLDTSCIAGTVFWQFRCRGI